MIDRVLHELVQHDGERCRDLAGEVAGVPFDAEADPQLRRRGGVLDQASQRPHDLAEVHDVAGLARQRLVHDRDGTDPALGFRERGPGFG